MYTLALSHGIRVSLARKGERVADVAGKLQKIMSWKNQK